VDAVRILLGEEGANVDAAQIGPTGQGGSTLWLAKTMHVMQVIPSLITFLKGELRISALLNGIKKTYRLTPQTNNILKPSPIKCSYDACFFKCII